MAILILGEYCCLKKLNQKFIFQNYHDNPQKSNEIESFPNRVFFFFYLFLIQLFQILLTKIQSHCPGLESIDTDLTYRF